MSYFILKKPIMVVIQNPINDVSINEINLKDVLQQVITDLGKGESELLIRIVDKAEIQNLNKTYRHKDKPTNVLSFPLELPEVVAEDLIGDLAICAELVVAEAQQQHKSINDHWAHLILHGTLHLLGYDHIEDEDANIMEALEVKLLDSIGLL